MLKIYIARHGQNVDNANGILNGHRDLPLTHVGVRQATELSMGIRDQGLSFDAVYASPLKRAFTTAEIVCRLQNYVHPIALDSLIERDFGVMTGQPIADIERMCAPDIVSTETITYFLSPAGAETFPDLLARASRTLSYIQALHQSGSILLVTHGDFGKMLYAAYYKLPWIDLLTKFHFGNCELLLLAAGFDTDEPHVIRIEQHNH